MVKLPHNNFMSRPVSLNCRLCTMHIGFWPSINHVKSKQFLTFVISPSPTNSWTILGIFGPFPIFS